MACPFWRAGLCPYVLRAETYTGEQDDEAYILDLSQLKCDVQVLKQSSTVTHYLFKKEQDMLQIRCVGACPDDHILKFTIRAGGIDSQGARDFSLKKLHYLIRNGDLSDRLFKANVSSQKFHKILKIIDLLKGEYRNRQVAEILYPMAQVDRDWGTDPSCLLEKKTSARIQGIRQLVAEGYLDYTKKKDS